MCVCLGVTPKSEAAFYRRVRFGFTIHAGTMLSFSAPVRRMFGALRGAGNFIGRIVLLHHILALASVHVYLQMKLSFAVHTVLWQNSLPIVHSQARTEDR